MSNIKYIRLVTGEDIISEVLEVSTEPHITLYSPSKIIYAFDGETKIRMQLIEWVFSNLVNTNTFALQRRDILLLEDASNDIKNTYLEHVSDISSHVPEETSNMIEKVLSKRSRNTLD